ncbi:hypothetical protein ACWD7C_08790 [Streptomyces sp. NPDC005134]|uniref:hypothetical protein n=1 Tax=unclassified Streptomyces TaxID=2593676 RepID=UPI0033B89BD4
MARRIEEGRPGEAKAVLNPDEPNPLLRFEYDRGSNYEGDTRITLAMAALIPEAELHNSDHRMFQIVHLINEYVWCSMHHELRGVIGALDNDDFGLAARLLTRTNGLADMPVQCVRLLQDFLPQASFLRMRDLLPANTSGLDSPGGRNLRRVCRALWQSFDAAMKRNGVTSLGLIEEFAREGGEVPAAWVGGLSTVQTGLHALDCKLMEWNQLHLRLVRTHLGGHPAARTAPMPASTSTCAASEGPTSLRGEPVSELERLSERSVFPLLWKTVDDAYRQATPAGTSGI